MATNETILTIDDLNAVIDALYNARAKWKGIGGGIGVDEGTLDTMKGSDNDCLRGMLTHWLRGVYKPGEQNSKQRTWHTLIEALRARAVNEEAMANKLEKEKYPGTIQASGSTATASPTTFSDALSPTDLVSWLSQQFQAKGLTLAPSLGQKLIDNDINGEAFMDLDDSYLDKMGFKIGQRMKIEKIIQSVKGGKEENGSKPVPVQEDKKVKAPSDTSELTISTLTRLKGKDGKEVEIMKAVTPKWQEFGQLLDFDPVGGHLDTINKGNRDPADSCKEMFRHWLNGNGIPATWSNVIDILDAIGLKVVARDVKAIIISSY